MAQKNASGHAYLHTYASMLVSLSSVCWTPLPPLFALGWAGVFSSPPDLHGLSKRLRSLPPPPAMTSQVQLRQQPVFAHRRGQEQKGDRERRTRNLLRHSSQHTPIVHVTPPPCRPAASVPPMEILKVSSPTRWYTCMSGNFRVKVWQSSVLFTWGADYWFQISPNSFKICLKYKFNGVMDLASEIPASVPAPGRQIQFFECGLVLNP